MKSASFMPVFKFVYLSKIATEFLIETGESGKKIATFPFFLNKLQKGKTKGKFASYVALLKALMIAFGFTIPRDDLTYILGE